MVSGIRGALRRGGRTGAKLGHVLVDPEKVAEIARFYADVIATLP
jgi:hypothetical protein